MLVGHENWKKSTPGKGPTSKRRSSLAVAWARPGKTREDEKGERDEPPLHPRFSPPPNQVQATTEEPRRDKNRSGLNFFQGQLLSIGDSIASLLTISSTFNSLFKVASFPHGTCALSVFRPYLALDGIYHPT